LGLKDQSKTLMG